MSPNVNDEAEQIIAYIMDRLIDVIDLVSFRFNCDREAAATRVYAGLKGLISNPEGFNMNNFRVPEMRAFVQQCGIERAEYLRKKGKGK